MTSQQYLKTKKRLSFDLRSEEAKLNYALKHCHSEMLDNCRARIAALEAQMNELERQ
jgi:hypothetical protein